MSDSVAVYRVGSEEDSPGEKLALGVDAAAVGARTRGLLIAEMPGHTTFVERAT